MITRAPRLIATLLFLMLCAAPAPAEVSYPVRPGQRDFVADTVGMIEPADLAAVRETCARLLEQRGIALVVVTIDSLRSFGADGWPIERYAMNLFAEWGIGQASQSRGVLLLVSKGDRKVRIELGSGWSRENDAAASAVTGGVIVPRFKAGRFSLGIREGVDELASRFGGASSAARAPPSGGLVPGPSTAESAQHSLMKPRLSPGVWICLGIGALIVIVLVFTTLRSGARSGAAPGPSGVRGMSGYGPQGWGGSGGNSWGGLLPGILLGQYLGSRGSSSRSDSGAQPPSRSSGGYFGGGGGGGFSSGGSFGGGFSGGGGSTGSW